MKRSELKQLIKEVMDETLTGYSYTVPEDQKTLATKFFLATYSYIKTHGQKKTHYSTVEPGGGWESDTWSLGNAKASDINKHFSKEVSGPNVAVSMASRNGKTDMIFSRGTLDDLKELLVSIIK